MITLVRKLFTLNDVKQCHKILCKLKRLKPEKKKLCEKEITSYKV